MAEWIAELVLNKQWPPNFEQIATGIAGLVKIGDIVSDCFFVNSLFEFRETFGPVLGVKAPSVTVFIAFATTFTIVGIIFDLYKAFIVVKEHRKSEQNGAITQETTWCEAMLASMRHHCFRCRAPPPEEDDVYSEEAKKKFRWWKRSNLVWEEIPQLIILVAFYATVRGVLVSCDAITETVKQCNENNNDSPTPLTFSPTPSPTSSARDTYDNYGFTPSISPNTFRRILDVDFHGEEYVDVLHFEGERKNLDISRPKEKRKVPSMPKVIIQTSPNSTLDQNWQFYRQSLEDLNPDFSFLHFNDEEALQFIEEHFPDTMLRNVYESLPRPVMKADVFRLAAVYVLGGFYMDMDMFAHQPLEPLTTLEYGTAIFPKEWKQNDAEFAARHFRRPSDDSERWQVGNYAFAATPQHDFVLDALNEAVARCFEIMSSSSSALVSDLDVLRATGPYMLSEVYHRGRKAGKYGDVYHMPGDFTEPLRHRNYGHNDWHKFGAYAEHMLSHTWTSHEFVQRNLQFDFYPTAAPTFDAPTRDFYPTSTLRPSPSPSQDFYAPSPTSVPTPSPDFYQDDSDIRANPSSDQCDTAERLIEQCTNDQENAQVDLSVAQEDLYLSSILSTVFTLLTIIGMIIVSCKERRKGENEADSQSKPAKGPSGATQHTMQHSSLGAPAATTGYPTAYMGAPAAMGYPAASMGATAVAMSVPNAPVAVPAASNASMGVPVTSMGIPPTPMGTGSFDFSGVNAPAPFAPVGAPPSGAAGKVKLSTTFQGLKLDCATARTNAVGLSIAKQSDGGFYVQHVREGGAAEAEGTIQVGDMVLAVNGETVGATWPLDRLVQAIRHAVETNAGTLIIDVKRISYEEYFSNET